MRPARRGRFAPPLGRHGRPRARRRRSGFPDARCAHLGAGRDDRARRGVVVGGENRRRRSGRQRAGHRRGPDRRSRRAGGGSRGRTRLGVRTQPGASSTRRGPRVRRDRSARSRRRRHLSGVEPGWGRRRDRMLGSGARDPGRPGRGATRRPGRASRRSGPPADARPRKPDAARSDDRRLGRVPRAAPAGADGRGGLGCASDRPGDDRARDDGERGG